MKRLQRQKWAESLSFPAQTSHSKRAVQLAALPPPLTGLEGRELGAAVAADACFSGSPSDNQHCFHPLSLSTCLPSTRRRRHTTQQRRFGQRASRGCTRPCHVRMLGRIATDTPSRPLLTGAPRRPRPRTAGLFEQSLRAARVGLLVSVSRCVLPKLPPRSYRTCRRPERTLGLAVTVAQNPPRVMVWFLIPDGKHCQCGPRALNAGPPRLHMC